MKVPSPMINTGGRHTLTSKDPLPLTHSVGPDDPEFGEYTISCFDGSH